tara:strand:+ start:1156 stop:1395 length:240 start_codon:yes stop_codon:yes gene_type:complete
MFLIEYGEGLFINADKIDWLQINSVGKITFTCTGDTETVYKVDSDYASSFVNNIQALSCVGGIEGKYHETIKNPQPSDT